jgi:medium-chain acyl-[acyl-carrier-protein] hydrolase
MTTDRWFNQPIVSNRVRARLICFPHAGGGSAIFANWAAKLPSEVELVAIRLPGRETRLRETAIDEWPTLLATLQSVLAPVLDRPFVLFGHSLGASIAYEMAATFYREANSRLAHLVVSGRHPPGYPQPRPPMHDLPKHEFLARLRELNGTPSEILGNDALMQLFERTLRADIRLAETWVPVGGAPLNVAITALAGATDEIAPPNLVSQWRSHTTREFVLRTFAAGHFFLQSAEDEIIEALGRVCQSIGN